MIKYTILYKNGKTWNGKANRLYDLARPSNDAVLLWVKGESGSSIYVPGVCSSWTNVPGTSIGKKPTRKHNPASVTKKQKAFDKAYAEWRTNKYSKPFPLGPGGADCSIKAYKKWLWEQKQAELKSVLKETSLDEFVKISFPSGASISWDTKGEPVQSLVKKITGEDGSDGWIPWYGGKCPVPYDSKVEVKFRYGGTNYSLPAGEWNWESSSPTGSHRIVAYRLLDEEGKPIKPSEPIKTTYTFWLGAFGEISDE